MHLIKPSKIFSLLLLYIVVFNTSLLYSQEKKSESFKDDPAYQQYIDFFEEVYETVNANYYKEVDRARFDRFMKLFNAKIYSQLKTSGKSVDFIRWRSAAFLMDHLKDQEDVFSAFYPPKPAKEYEETALGKKINLGITGLRKDNGWEIADIEPRSDAYIKGLRVGDIITFIQGKRVTKLTDKEINELLSPLEDEQVAIKYISHEDKKRKDVLVLSKEYFEQSVFPIAVDIPQIYGLKIERFNRKTSDDLFRYLNYYRTQGDIKGLIIDLRDNPGGPPLAAREMASFFLPPGDEFAYFSTRGEKKAELNVPVIPDKYHYDGPMVILVNEKSGSASELFSGILQNKDRAVLMGSNSAGQVMLKSMFHFDDDSMVLLITARGHHPDGQVFSFSGLIPDKKVESQSDVDIIQMASKYLIYKNMKEN